MRPMKFRAKDKDGDLIYGTSLFYHGDKIYPKIGENTPASKRQRRRGMNRPTQVVICLQSCNNSGERR